MLSVEFHITKLLAAYSSRF